MRLHVDDEDVEILRDEILRKLRSGKDVGKLRVSDLKGAKKNWRVVIKYLINAYKNGVRMYERELSIVGEERNRAIEESEKLRISLEKEKRRVKELRKSFKKLTEDDDDEEGDANGRS